jgi:hypothetical protein
MIYTETQRTQRVHLAISLTASWVAPLRYIVDLDRGYSSLRTKHAFVGSYCCGASVFSNRCLCRYSTVVFNWSPVHRAQVLTYLKLTNLRLGLLINFNVEVLRSGLYRIING